MQPVNLRGTLISLEYQFIDEALQSTHGNVAQAAKLLNINRTTLIEKLRARLYRTQGGLYDPASPHKEITPDSYQRQAQTYQPHD